MREFRYPTAAKREVPITGLDRRVEIEDPVAEPADGDGDVRSDGR